MKNIKAYVISVIVISVIISLFCVAFEHSKVSNLYAKSAVVTHVNHVTDTATIQDNNGFCWEFKGCEDWQVNDNCACIMNDNATKQIYDDEIISVTYENNC